MRILKNTLVRILERIVLRILEKILVKILEMILVKILVRILERILGALTRLSYARIQKFLNGTQRLLQWTRTPQMRTVSSNEFAFIH